MSFTPGYGETPVPDDDLDVLHQHVRDSLGESITKATVYDLEQVVQADVAEDLATAVLEGTLTYDDLLRDHFVRDLHKRLYGEIWVWGGVFRRRELNIGVEPSQIAVQLRGSLDAIRYRWEQTDDWTSRQLGIAVHAETVRIHPFTDGNGRTTRLLADLVFVATQNCDLLEQYVWDLDKARYVTLLREYDRHRDATDLAAFIAVQPFGE